MNASGHPAVPIPILMYHNIARLPREVKRNRSLYVNPGAFARQMWLLHRLGYTGLSMSAAMPYLRGEKSGRVAVITLDDGYADNLDAALPVLQRYRFSATCYVVSGALGQHNTWDADKLSVRKPMMTPTQMRAWHAGGMEVGAHTRTHPHLTQLQPSRMQDEIGGCKADLENLLGQPVSQFCYPYGDMNEHVAEAARAAGFDAATTTRRGRARAGMDLWQLPRVPVVRQHVLPQFASRILTGYEDRRR
ncbi:polysaccharide deacetylase family protein [Dyella sp. A6]|uniref:polysaccharide deacetylase family protein n=1 Tax=Dyella aluminiiresistens TaxID=3069105 RepID=UPI002E776C25|nr:polysaccharide deacetylase family protein [Dyella sp. A6]